MKSLRPGGSLGAAAILMARFTLAQNEEPAVRRPLPAIPNSESEIGIEALYNVKSVAPASEHSEFKLARSSLRFFGEGSQDVPASDAGPAGERLEGTRGSVGGFVGFSTAGAEGVENGFLIGGNAAFFFLDYVGIEAGIHRRSTDLAQTPSNALSAGSLDSTIATAGVVVRFPVSARVVPYVAGGVAYFSNSFEVDPSLTGRLAALNFQVTEEVDSALGFNVGGGADVLVARRFVVFGEVRYLDAMSDTRAEIRDTISGTTAKVGGSQDLNALEIRVGVRFVFSRGQRKAGKS